MGITDRSRAGFSKAQQRRIELYKAAKAKAPSESKTNVTQKDVDAAFDAWQKAKDILEECNSDEYNMHWQEANRRSVIYETLVKKLAKGQ